MENATNDDMFYLTNTQVLKTLIACEEILGESGMAAVLKYAKLSYLVDHYPPDNLDKVFSFEKYSQIMLALETVYGKRGGRTMGMRIGRAGSKLMINNFNIMMGTMNPAFNSLPVLKKMHLVLIALTKILAKISDMTTHVVEHEDSFEFVFERCPVCWGRHDEDKPMCYNDVGLLKGLMYWASNGKEFRIVETKCIAVGDDVCAFRIPKTPEE